VTRTYPCQRYTLPTITADRPGSIAYGLFLIEDINTRQKRVSGNPTPRVQTIHNRHQGNIDRSKQTNLNLQYLRTHWKQE
jgi:hypothetical protein